jgi:hypothetical protein
LFGEQELADLLAENKPPPEPFIYETIRGMKGYPSDEEWAAKVTPPKDADEYERTVEDYALRLEILGDKRRGIDGAYRPRQRQQLDREFMALAAEKAAYITAYDLQAEQRAMAAYENSELGKAEKESIDRNAAAARGAHRPQGRGGRGEAHGRSQATGERPPQVARGDEVTDEALTKRLGYAVRKQQQQIEELTAALEKERSRTLFHTVAEKFVEAGLTAADARHYLTSRPWRELTPDNTAGFIDALVVERERAAQEERRNNGPTGFAPTYIYPEGQSNA